MTDQKSERTPETSNQAPTWLRSLYTSTSLVGPLGLLRATHQGKVLEDGVQRGVIGMIADIAGMPVDAYKWVKERVTGLKDARPKEEISGSSEWIEKKLITAREKNNEYLTGRKGPEIRPGTGDEYISMAGQGAALVGSFFLPGAGQVRAASMLGKLGKAGEVAASVGSHISPRALAITPLVAGGTAWAVEAAEKKMGVERAVDVTTLSASPVAAINKNHAQIPDLGPLASTVSASVRGQKIGEAAGSGADILVINALGDFSTLDTFGPEKVKSLQKALVAGGFLKPEGPGQAVDGIFGKRTAEALDSSIRGAFKPSDVTPAQRAHLEQEMRRIGQDLAAKPASPYSHDVRVVALQVNAYMLGLYDGKIDGLQGVKTTTAMADLDRSGAETRFAARPSAVAPG